MNPTQPDIAKFFQDFSPVTNAATLYEWTLRVLFLLTFFLYVLFAVVIVRQVRMMDETIKTPLSGVLQIFSWLHLAAAVLLLVFAFFTL